MQFEGKSFAQELITLKTIFGFSHTTPSLRMLSLGKMVSDKRIIFEDLNFF